jgi:hypothetical protein
MGGLLEDDKIRILKVFGPGSDGNGIDRTSKLKFDLLT